MPPKSSAQFIHLRTHSAYSLLEGAIAIEEMVELCQKYAMPAVALTDSGNLFGSLEFSMACAEAGIQPIIGCVLAVEEQAKGNNKPETSQLVVLAKNETGYQNLLSLVSKSFLEGSDGHKPTVNFEQIEAYAEGLIALTGGPKGVLGFPLLKGQTGEAERRIDYLKRWFSGRLYIELTRHGMEIEQQTEASFIDFAYRYDVPLVATNDVYFASSEMAEAHEVLCSIADGTYITDEKRRRFSPEHYFKTAREMAKLFADIPEAIANTVTIAKRCAVMSEARKPLLPRFPTEGGREDAEELKALSSEGLKKRLEHHVFKEEMGEKERQEVAAPYEERLAYELGVITRMDYSGYFLVVSDFIRWSKQQGIPVGPGRGSGAGSVVAWALEITNLDPLRFGLLFERFLNPDRISMPDFDIDFCQERRDEVIRYVRDKYGADRVAQIITFGKLQARAVLRDVGRVLQMPYSRVDRICKMIPFNPLAPVTLSRAIEMDPELKRERDSDEEVAKLLDIGLKLEGLYRHASTHAAGVVIGDRPLQELLPLYRDPRSDMLVTQYSMKYAESAGLVKFDFLGLKTLTVIAHACKLIEAQGTPINIERIPLDDKPTFAMLSRGETTGVFQMESAGMRDALRKMKPDTIEDIIALISLYRPGPMDNIPTYIARKHGKEKPDYLHPMLKDILKETYGVIIYQEQVMQIAQVLAGYSLGAADLLRRAMGKKIKEEMDAQRDQFVEGAIKNGVSKAQAETIFELVAKFAGYGFNKSHAAAYAMIGYQTAYLKANFPMEFITAFMNIDIGDTDKINTYKEEAMRSGIKILPPDVNKSRAEFRIEQGAGFRIQDSGENTPSLPSPASGGGLGWGPLTPESRPLPPPAKAIRYALGAIKNVGFAAMQVLVEEREAHGKFVDIFDVAARCDSQTLGKRQWESLAKAGAFNSLYPNRRELFEAALILIRYSQTMHEEKNSGQENLFGAATDVIISKPIIPSAKDWEVDERLTYEKEAIGFYLTAHPLDPFKDDIKAANIVTSATLEEVVKHAAAEIKVAGVVTSITHRASARGRFAYVALSDPYGALELSIFDERLISEKRELLESSTPLIMTADAKKDEGGVRLSVTEIAPLSQWLNERARSHIIVLEHTRHLNKLSDFLASLSGGGAKLYVMVYTPENMAVKIALPQNYNLKAEEINRLGAIEGIIKVT